MGILRRNGMNSIRAYKQDVCHLRNTPICRPYYFLELTLGQSNRLDAMARRVQYGRVALIHRGNAPPRLKILVFA